MTRKLCWLGVAMILTVARNASAAGDGPVVRLTKKADTLEVRIGDELFTAYNFNADLPKPYFFPMHAATGKNVLHVFPAEKPASGEYHPHHKGMWIAIDEVNTLKFWAEKAKIANRSIEILKAEGNPASFRARNEWLGDDGKPVVTESTTVEIHSNRLLTYAVTFTAGAKPVTFEDTKEGLFAVRMNQQMREATGGGKITNADGKVGEKDCWGQESNWVDYSGKVDGVTQGLAIFDHPGNFRRSRWHVRAYGLFAGNPFGGKSYTRDAAKDGTHKITAGESLTLRYAVYVHSGDAKEGKVAEQYQAYAKAAR